MSWFGKLHYKVSNHFHRLAYTLAPKRQQPVPPSAKDGADENEQIAVFHVTHLKAGSQWVAEVLRHSVYPGRIVEPQVGYTSFSSAMLKPGGVFLTLYEPQPTFAVATRDFPHPMRTFVVMRDLRDTLISLYFSVRYSHGVVGIVKDVRPLLNSMSEEEGLLFLLGANLESRIAQIAQAQAISDPASLATIRHSQTILRGIANAQLSWMNADHRLLIRYEELVADAYPTFQQIIDYCEIPVKQARLQTVVKYSSFEHKTGRKAGQADIMAHRRKGIAGDWKNYFTDKVKEEFKRRYDDILLATKYEDSLNW